jgi:hypothetical protein
MDGRRGEERRGVDEVMPFKDRQAGDGWYLVANVKIKE